MDAAYLKNISHKPIGYNTAIDTDGVQSGSLNSWIYIVLQISFKVVWFL